MIIIRLFFFVLALFFALSVLLGALVWLKLRLALRNPFDVSGKRSARGDNVIEGQYEVLNEERKDRNND